MRLRIKRPKPDARKTGNNAAISGLSPKSMMVGSKTLWKIVNNNPAVSPTKTLYPVVASLSGPNTEDTPRSTSARVINGWNIFFQRAR